METVTILQTMMTLHMHNKTSISHGFTLFELIIVLMIIAAMVTVAIPYATRSNESLKIKQECLNIAETIKYAIDLATDTKKPTRIVINPKDKSYLLEIATGTNSRDYKPTGDFQGAVRYLGQTIHIMEMIGFDVEGSDRYLIFDPTRPWPDASFSLLIGDVINTIKIRGKQVEIEESTI